MSNRSGWFAGGWSADGVSEMTVASSWAARPIAASDGSWLRLVDTGAIFRFSSILNEWVRPVIYDGTVVLDARITGSILPSAENPVWTHLVSNGGTVTSVGGKVIFDASTTANKTASVSVNAGEASISRPYFLQGLFQMTGPLSGAFNHRLELRDGTRQYILGFNDQANGGNVRLLTAGGSVLSDNRNANVLTEKLVELMCDADIVTVFVGASREPACTAQRTAFSVLASQAFIVGDTSASGGGLLTARQVLAGRF